MPSYTFINHKTQEERDEVCMIAEMESFLAANPDWDVKPAVFGVGDAVRQGMKKPSEGFRDILRHIKKKHKGGSKSDYTNGVNTF
jgi:hypothetical protein